MRTQEAPAKAKIHYLKDYTPPSHIIDSVFLHFDLHEDHTQVKAILKMRRNPNAKHNSQELVLFGQEMMLKAVSIDGKILTSTEYQTDAETLTIKKVPEQFTLETEVTIKPHENTQLNGLYKSRSNFCTQCEPHGFRRITYYLDRPDVMSRFTTTITADKTRYPILLSNGNLVEQRDLSDNRHWVHWEDPSLKPSYLFALVAGDFDLLKDEFITQNNRKIDLRLYVERGYKDQAGFALQALKRAMRWDEETFGREYDLDIYMIVAVSDFNMGAMENKGLNIFNTKYILAKPETATDNDFVAIESVIGHEYFHNWSGNRVTCRDWFQITLKEGLTVLRDELFTEDMTSRAVARLDTINVLRTKQFIEDAGPLSHPIRPEQYLEINNFYTTTVYRKGAEVIRMVRTLLTPSIFRKGMDLYFSRHDGHAVTTEDFLRAMSDASEKDLSQFSRWYHQSGTPILDITGNYQADKKIFELKVKQSCPPTPNQPQKKPFLIPLALGLIGKSGSELLATRIIEVTKEEETFTFENISEKPIPSLLRDFSAPVKLNYPYSFEELALLAQYDTDAFVRWNALQQLAQKVIEQLIPKYEKQETLTLGAELIKAFDTLIHDTNDDLSLLSRLFILPSDNYLLINLPGKDIESIHHVRVWVKKQLAQHFEKSLLQHYETNRSKEVYQFNAQDMGRRALKNVVLNYLLEANKSTYAKKAYEQFKNADNMTDRMGGLAALNNHACPEREKALQEFYELFEKEPLVINKWFALQASSTLPETLEHVKNLMQHPAFNIKNPNNVYFLLGSFADNTARFHDKSGAGYRFIADQIIAIDPINPQVASRLIQPLTQWRLMDSKRAELMKQELKRIASQPKLSKDIQEMVLKSL